MQKKENKINQIFSISAYLLFDIDVVGSSAQSSSAGVAVKVEDDISRELLSGRGRDLLSVTQTARVDKTHIHKKFKNNAKSKGRLYPPTQSIRQPR